MKTHILYAMIFIIGLTAQANEPQSPVELDRTLPSFRKIDPNTARIINLSQKHLKEMPRFTLEEDLPETSAWIRRYVKTQSSTSKRHFAPISSQVLLSKGPKKVTLLEKAYEESTKGQNRLMDLLVEKLASQIRSNDPRQIAKVTETLKRLPLKVRVKYFEKLQHEILRKANTSLDAINVGKEQRPGEAHLLIMAEIQQLALVERKSYLQQLQTSPPLGYSKEAIASGIASLEDQVLKLKLVTGELAEEESNLSQEEIDKILAVDLYRRNQKN